MHHGRFGEMSLTEFYKGKKVLVTGHTGFKGAWLCYWLELLGAEVTGYALPPTTSPNLHSLLAPAFPQTLADITNKDRLSDHLQAHRPELVFHLAAQALVRESYQDPLGTFHTNIVGTWNLLDCVSQSASVKAVVFVTTDKCYRNDNQANPFSEDSPLGGHDPYSASKACAEILCESWRSSYWKSAGSPLLATARAGNVIGGGDWAKDRLIPDAVRALQNRKTLMIRNPLYTRPWQHVLDPLCGYLLLGKKLFEGKPQFAHAWNFAPPANQSIRVQDVLAILNKTLPKLHWQTDTNQHPHEASTLSLLSDKASQELGWNSRWNVIQAIDETAAWYSQWLEGASPSSLCQKQIELYTKGPT